MMEDRESKKRGPKIKFHDDYHQKLREQVRRSREKRKKLTSL